MGKILELARDGPALFHLPNMLSSLRRQPRATGAQAPEEDEADPLLRAQLALQGIAPRPRMQLLACALGALEQEMSGLAQQPQR